MERKSIEQYFNPKIEGFDKIKEQKRTLDNFNGEVFIDNSLGYERFVSENFSLANKIDIDITGYDKSRLFYLYFELPIEKTENSVRVYCRDSELQSDLMNVVYERESEEGRGHYDTPTFVTTRHPVTTIKILNYYKELGVKKDLVSKIKDEIEFIRKEASEGVKRYW